MAIRTGAPTDPNSSGNFGNMRRMAGTVTMTEPDTDSSQESSSSASDPQQKLQSVVQILRQSEESISGIAEAFPQAADEIRTARSAIRSVLKKIVSNPGSDESPAPRSGY